MQSKQQKSTEMQQRPPKSSKNEILIFILCSTSDDGQVIQATKVDQNAKKAPQVIRVMEVDQNAKKVKCCFS